MNWERVKRNENRRIRDAIECREAQKVVTVGQLAAYIIITVCLAVIGFCVCKMFEPNEERIREEIEREEAARVTMIQGLKDEILRETARAAEIVKRDPQNGLARFALVAGWTMYNAEVI